MKNVKYVPVASKTGKPLMPCHPARARELLRKGRAIPRHRKGMFYIQLTEREDGNVQPVACGLDPGSKKEGITVKSEKRTFINIQADAVTYVQDALTTRREMRRGRRYRKTPCRSNRKNRARGGIPPSTLARWHWKLRLCQGLAKLYPISVFVVEDIKAKTTGKRRWDASFSPLQVGKEWFYTALREVSRVELRSGWETKLLRDAHGLKKSGRKTAEVFEAHCVDSFTLAASVVGGFVPDNKDLTLARPIRLHRRQLHALQPSKGGYRRPYGGTRSHGFKRGTIVQHIKRGLCYVGGVTKDRISLHSIKTGHRLCHNAKPADCQFINFTSWVLGCSRSKD